MTARRQFGGAIAVCVLGAALAFFALRQDWARVYYTAPAPLPSGSLAVTGQSLLPAASALALAAVACLAAIIATRGLARRIAALLMAGLGVWIAALAAAPVHAASVVAAMAGQGSPGGLAGSVPGGNSAISGNTSGGSLPVIGTVSRVLLSSGGWRPAAVAGAILVIAAGLAAAWPGQRWPVMSARFDRPSQQPGPPGTPDAQATRAAPTGDSGELWEALDRGEDLTEPAATRRDEP
ncbi:MAG TPA: Trp biosynthesis-associated membrane protein [Streptosporangiaceae bacterium]